jgi:hypothetical protein
MMQKQIFRGIIILTIIVCSCKKETNTSTWVAINTGFPVTDTYGDLPYVYSMAISGNSMFAGTDHGVYLSSNNGNSWKAMNTGLPSYTSAVICIVFDKTYAYIGTGGNGVYKQLLSAL